MSLTFLVGGARSGKSALSIGLASAFEGPVVVVVTAEARDEEMARRIADHRAARPPGWTTVEAPLALEEAVAAVEPGAFVILDCLTVWVSNVLEAGRGDDAVLEDAVAIARALEGRTAPSVIVSNEVGLGIVPANALARRYRDVLGRVNAVVAGVAARSLLVVAGRGLPLEEVAPA